MNSNHPRNACPGHEWEASLSEAGRDTCVWCGAGRETPPRVIRGVDYPGAGPVADAVRERAA